MFNLKNIYIYILLVLMLMVGGFGIESVWMSWSGMLLFSLLLLTHVLQRKKLTFPKYFKLFLVIIGLMVINLFTAGNPEESLKYLFLFVGGGFLWLFCFNYLAKIENNKLLTYLLVFLTLFFGQYVIFELILKTDTIRSFAIISYSSIGRNHHHIGDFMSLIAAISLYKILEINKKRLWWGVSWFVSLSFIFFSQSRSALMSLVMSGGLLFWSKGYFEKYKRFTFLSSILIIGFLFYFAQYKSLLLSRDFFVEGLVGFVRNPLFGVGMGNFSEISLDAGNHLWGMDGFSVSAHNLPLEFLIGMGVWGLTFVYFYFKTFRLAIENFGRRPIPVLVFIALSVNFFFDFTYTNPTMLWLWFASLGFLETTKSETIKI